MALVINDQHIGDDVLEEEFDAIKEHYMNLGEVVCCDRDEEFRAYARDNVLNRTLLEQESLRRFGEPSEADVGAMLDRLKAEHGGEEEFYRNTGYTAKDEFRIRRKVATTLAVDKLLETEIGAPPEPTEEELRGFYDENLSQYQTEEQVRVSQIFREPKSHADAKGCYVQLREAREKLLEGADFEALSREISDKPAEQTDLGYFKQGETMPEIEALTFSMRVGEISPVVATHFGFHIFKVTERKAPEAIPFETVRDSVGERFVAERREKAIEALLDAIKAKTTIEEREEAADHA